MIELAGAAMGVAAVARSAAAAPVAALSAGCRRDVIRSDSGIEIDLRVAAGGIAAPAARARRAVAAKAAHRTRADVDFARGDIAAVDLEEGPIAGETRAAGAAGQSVAAGAAPAGRIHRQVPADIDVDRRSRLKRIGHEEARRAAVAVAAGTAGARGVRGPVAAGRSAAEARLPPMSRLPPALPLPLSSNTTSALPPNPSPPVRPTPPTPPALTVTVPVVVTSPPSMLSAASPPVAFPPRFVPAPPVAPAQTFIESAESEPETRTVASPPEASPPTSLPDPPIPPVSNSIDPAEMDPKTCDRGAAAGADAARDAASAEPVIVEAQAAADDDRRCPEREDAAAVSGFVGKPALANAAEACRTIAAEAGRIEGHVPVEVHDPDARALKDRPKAVATAAICPGPPQAAAEREVSPKT